jgi:hypothetical protein
VHATLATDLAVGYEEKVNLKISKVEREVEKLNRILALEKQRAERSRF